MPSIIFQSKKLNHELFKKGFVKIPFWSYHTALEVKQHFIENFELRHKSRKKFHTSYETTDASLINDVNEYLQPKFLRKTQALFSNMKPVSASFLVKEPGENSSSPMHQDAQFVDEPNHYSVSIWVALQNCNDNNSCLQFVPGSHRLYTNIRHIPYNNDHINPYLLRFRPYLTRHSINAGEAFVFLNAVLHASADNLSNDPRYVAVMGFYPAADTLSLYFKSEAESSISRYAITPNQLMQINDVFTPIGKNLISTHALPHHPTQQEVSNFIKNNFGWRSIANKFFKTKPDF